MRYLIATLMCITQLFISSLVRAQDTSDAIKAARPDQTEGTNVVDPGDFQIESGPTSTHFDASENAFTGRLHLRYGVHKRVELQAMLEDGRQRDAYIDETVQSVYPLSIGPRIVLVQDHPFLPDITLVSYFKLPFTSRSADQKPYWSPTVIAAFSNEFGVRKQFQLEYNVGMKQAPYGRDISWLGSASLEYFIIKQLYIFGEYFAEYQSGEDPSNNVDGGVAWLLNNNLQLDIAAGSTIHVTQGNQFVSAGIAYRIKHR